MYARRATWPEVRADAIDESVSECKASYLSYASNMASGQLRHITPAQGGGYLRDQSKEVSRSQPLQDMVCDGGHQSKDESDVGKDKWDKWRERRAKRLEARKAGSQKFPHQSCIPFDSEKEKVFLNVRAYCSSPEKGQIDDSLLQLPKVRRSSVKERCRSDCRSPSEACSTELNSGGSQTTHSTPRSGRSSQASLGHFRAELPWNFSQRGWGWSFFPSSRSSTKELGAEKGPEDELLAPESDSESRSWA
jgi:hypothetical protein